MKKIRRKYLFLTDKKALKGFLRGRAILSHSVNVNLGLATTIGYGNVVPETQNGKIFCLIFVTVGIPYFGYMMSMLSENVNIIVLKVTKKLLIYSKNSSHECSKKHNH